MAEPIELRVGICKCTTLYHGTMEGLGMRLHGHRFRIKEVALANTQYHTAELKERRCHFFIDADHYDTVIYLEKDDLIMSPSERSERLAYQIFLCNPLCANGMRRLIREILSSMKKRDLRDWLKRMR